MRKGEREGKGEGMDWRGSRIGTTRESAQLVVRRKSRFDTARGSAQIAKRAAETVSDDRFPCSRPVPRLVFEMSGK